MSATRKVSRVFSVFLCAFLALGCVWAQQGLSALDSVTSGLVTGTEANKITGTQRTPGIPCGGRCTPGSA